MNFTPKTFCKHQTLAGGTLAVGTVTSAAIDMEGWNQAMIVSSLHDDGAAGTMVTVVEETNEDPATPDTPEAANWTAITGATTSTESGAGVSQSESFSIKKEGRKRFLRTVTTIAANNCEGNVDAILMHPEETDRVDPAASWVEVGALPSPLSSSFA